MRAVVQRVASARVTVDSVETGAIGHGLLAYLGIGEGDGEPEVEWLTRKLLALRIFEDDAGKMNRSVVDVGGAILVVSQFTLYADVARGNRPSFGRAAPPDIAESLYERVVGRLRERVPVATGRFRADMRVESVGYGPITIPFDTALDAPALRGVARPSRSHIDDAAARFVAALTSPDALRSAETTSTALDNEDDG